jgi:hypothetical protein
LLLGEVGHGSGDENGQIGGDSPVFKLQPLGLTGTVLVMGFVVHPVAEE